MWRWGNPQALNLLWLLVILFLLTGFQNRRAAAQVAKTFGKKIAGFLTASVSDSRRQLKLWLRFAALSFFVLALARPQIGKGTQAIKSEGVEIVMALDVSTSMLSEDVKPSRLAFAKAELMRVLDLLGGDKVGLVAFAGSAITVSPLTTDKSALKMYLEGLTTQSVQTQGTEFRKAFLEAEKAFERGGIDPDEGVKVTRVILVASDGEDQEPGAQEAANQLAQKGIRIFTLAFGSEKGAPISLRDETGILRGYKKDKAGHDVLSKVNDEMLRDLAKAGKGSFYHATPGGDQAKLVRADIDQLQKAMFDSQVAASYDEKFQIFLWMGLALAALEILIPERRPIGRVWRGRFEVQQQ